MLTATALPLSPADLACQAAGDAQFFRATLHELIDMGMDMARVAHKQVTAEVSDAAEGASGAAAPAPMRDAAAAFDRLSRAVRRTVALARHVAQPLPVRAESGQHVAVARRQVLRAVEDEIQRTAEVDREALHAELLERLDALELDEEIDCRPVAEIIADIGRDLGLGRFLGNHPWKRRTPAEAAALCAWAAKPAGAPAPPGLARPVPGPGEPWPEPQPYTLEPAAPPREAAADAAAASDAACVAQMWRALAEAGQPTPFRPRDG